MKNLNKTLWIALVAISFSCNEPTDNSSQQTPNSAAVTADTSRSDNYAAAQVVLFIETLKNRALAFTTLDIYAPVNEKGKFKAKTLLVGDYESGPFSRLTIVDKAVISKNGLIKVMLSFELQTPRINWEAEQGEITGNYGEAEFKQTIKSEGGSLSGTATLVFDENTMKLISQVSEINRKSVSMYKQEDSNYIEWAKFASKNLKPRLATTINWTNATCNTQNGNCTTGQMKEND